MKSYDELKALIEQRGVHAEFGDAGEGWGIEQNPHELATFLVRMQELGVASVLEIGTGYKGGLSRFLAQDMGWDVTTVDVKNYGHAFEGVHYIVISPKSGLDAFWHDYLTNNDRFDLVFIDGNHDYKHVEFDYRYHAQRANKAIAFHDTIGLRGCEGVNQFWEEIALTSRDPDLLKPNHKHTFDLRGNGSGIGWIEL